MKNTDNKSFKESLNKFLSGKGFYVALAFCLLGTGAAAWVAVDRTLAGIENNNDLHIGQIEEKSEEKEWGFPTTEPTEKPQTDVTISDESSTSSQSQQSSSVLSEQPEDSSVLSEQETVSQELLYVLPAQGEIVGAYSAGRLVKDVTLNEWRTHNGIDIKLPVDSPIYAVSAGEVADIYNDAMWGWVVEISHSDGHLSYYSGLSKNVMVAKGDTVKLGQQIGVLEVVPAEIATDPHLHFGMKKDGVWVDPLAAMGKLKD